MKIVITGGSGFIGSSLAKMLHDQGHEISILDLQPSRLFPQSVRQIDVRDRVAVIEGTKGADIIFHLAAEHRDDVRPIQKYYDVNVGGAENIVVAAEANDINAIIFTSTVAVYGLDAGDAREERVPAPFNDYGHSKLRSEQIFEEWSKRKANRSLVIVRPVATFGPDNRGNVHVLMDQIKRRKFLMVGSGKNLKSMAYVENVAAFLMHALQFDAGLHVYNYADKPDLSTHDLVNTITDFFGHKKPRRIPYVAGLAGGALFDLAAMATGRTFPVSAVRVRKFRAHTIVNADKVKQSGFSPPHDLKKGLRAMLDKDFK